MTRIFGLCALLAIFGAAARADDGDTLTRILTRGTVRVATTGDYQPFSYDNPVTGDYEGSDIELAHRLAHSLGVKLVIVPTTWSSLVADLDAGKFDIAMGGVTVTLDRQKHGLFSIPYAQDGKTALTRCGSEGRFQTLAQVDQPGVHVIESPGGTNEAYARANIVHADIGILPTNRAAYDALVAGQGDVMLTDAIEARLQQSLRPSLCAVHPGQPFTFLEKAYLLPNDTRWKAWVDQWLHQAIGSGEYTRVFHHWVRWKWLQTPPQNDLDRLAALIAERLKLARDVAEYKWNHGMNVADTSREQEVLDDIVGQAQKAGIDPAMATAFFKAQFEASKTVQRALFAKWETSHTRSFEDVPDLDQQTRPKLDALTIKLVALLAANKAVLTDPLAQDRILESARRYLSASDWGDAAAIAQSSILLSAK